MANRAVKTKAAAMPAAQTRDEAEQAIARIGDNQRLLKRIEADLGDAVAAAKAVAEREAEPVRIQIMADQALVQGWCEANRAALTGGGKVKFAVLTTGKVLWRLRPPSVKIRGEDSVIAFLKDRLQGRFIRTKEEIDREALKAEPETARTIPGVTIGSEGEDFVIEPHDAELAGAA